MNNLKLVSVIIFLSISLFSSCENSTEPISDIISGISTDLIPIEINNTWNYNMEIYRYNSTSSTYEFSDSSKVIMKVLKLDTLSTYIGFDIENIPFGVSWRPGKKVYSYKDDGLYFAESSADITVPPSQPSEKILLKYPTKIGEKTSFNGFNITPKTKDEKITLYNKTYSCIKFEVKIDNDVVGEIWVSPKIGIVKTWQNIGVNTKYYYLNNYTLY